MNNKVNLKFYPIMQSVIFAVCIVAIPFDSKAALDQISGYRLMQDCENHLDDKNQSNPHSQGLCLGIIMGVTDISKSICIPNEKNYVEILKVFLKYLDKHPEHLHKRLSYLVQDALTIEWPC